MNASKCVITSNVFDKLSCISKTNVYVLMLVILMFSANLAACQIGALASSVDTTLEFIAPDKIGVVSKPSRTMHVSFITADEDKDLKRMKSTLLELNYTAGFEVFTITESIVNANMVSSQRVRGDTDVVIIIGHNIMNYGIRTLGFHIVDFIETHSSKSFVDVM